MKTMRIHSVWPTLNKQDTLARYVEQVRAMDFVPGQAEIAETIYLTIGEWEAFTKHLLDERTWLSGKGGCTERGVRSVLLVVRPGETAQESLGILVDPREYRYGWTLTELDAYFHTLSEQMQKQSAIRRAQHMLCQAYIAHLDKAIHGRP